MNEIIMDDANEIRKLLNLMEGKTVLINWNTNGDTKTYNIDIEGQNFILSDTNIFFLLDFFGFKSFYPDNRYKNIATIQIPKLWYKDQELKNLLKDGHVQTKFWSYKKGAKIRENINRIMRNKYENMKTLYFSHPMITYNKNIEKVCLDIIDREIGNKLPSSIKDVINPNSDEYKWKGEHDMHEAEDWGFSWEGFANSMPHYCDLVYKSDGLIYLPIFDLNTRKNARVRFTRKIKRGVKTEISYCTKLGDPLITFTDPDNNMLPTDIELPYYMLDHINGIVSDTTCEGNDKKIINKVDDYQPNSLPNKLGDAIGVLEGDVIKDINGTIIAKVVKTGHMSCDRCHHCKSIQINEKLTENQLNEFIKNPHRDCGGNISFFNYDHENIIDIKGDIVGYTRIDKDFINKISYKHISWTSFKGNICRSYNREEHSHRYNSPYPFHMYINKITKEIHEKPEGAGSIGGCIIPFEPWNNHINEIE